METKTDYSKVGKMAFVLLLCCKASLAFTQPSPMPDKNVSIFAKQNTIYYDRTANKDSLIVAKENNSPYFYKYMPSSKVHFIPPNSSKNAKSEYIPQKASK